MADNEKNSNRDILQKESKEGLAFFKLALAEALDLKIREDCEDIKAEAPSKRHKIRMNRLFREYAGSTFLPYPEADNLYERIRSKIIRKLKINKHPDRKQKHKCSNESNGAR